MEEKKNVAGAAGGTLVNFVLLEQPAFDREQLIRDLQKEWGLPVNGEKEAPATGNVVFDADGMIAAVPSENNNAIIQLYEDVLTDIEDEMATLIREL